MPIAKNRLHFRLLFLGEIQLFGQHLRLLVGIHPTAASTVAAVPHVPALIISSLHRRLPVLVALTVGVAAVNRFAGPLPPRTFSMSTGREGGAYHQFALEYRRLLAR